MERDRAVAVHGLAALLQHQGTAGSFFAFRVAPDGSLQRVDYTQIPDAYSRAPYLLEKLDRRSAAEREPVCAALAEAYRDQGVDVDAIHMLFGPEAPARLLAVQGLFLVLIALRTVLSPYPKLAGAPAALFEPAWIVSWLDAMPPREVIVAVQSIVVIAAIAWFAIGRNLKWRGPVRRGTYAVAWLGFLFLAALRAGRGKIFHIELLPVWALFPIMFAPGDACLSDRWPRGRYGWTIRTAIVVMAVIYCFTGIWKLRNSGLEWVFSDNIPTT
jgi:hypothetical protein